MGAEVAMGADVGAEAARVGAAVGAEVAGAAGAEVAGVPARVGAAVGAEVGTTVGADVAAGGAAVGADASEGGADVAPAIGALDTIVGAEVPARIGAVAGATNTPLRIEPNTDVTAGAVTNFLFSQSELVTKKPDAYASAVQSRAAPLAIELIHTKSHPWVGQKSP